VDTQLEKDIIAGVLKRLAAEGFLTTGSSSAASRQPAGAASAAPVPADTAEAPLTLGPMDAIGVANPKNVEALKVMRKSTPARILLGRAGARQKTDSFLRFQADHAAAIDAVFMDVSEEVLAANGLIQVQTVVRDKDEYLMKPNLGKKLSDDAKRTIAGKIEKGKQVQIIVVDGLSSTSIEANIADIMPALIQGLKSEGLSVGTPFYIKYGRVGVMDDVAPLVNCDVIVELIGERPGLITAESMSAYMAYRPSHSTVEAERTVISNIHRGGTPPAEAGAHLATVVKKMVDHKASGVKLSQLLKN
jgi:ethanolamine ammonia-lyase small subunit